MRVISLFFHIFQVRERFGKPLENDFFIVPKLPINMADSEYWRMDFHLAEDQIIYNYGCVRPVIKLLKYFRDCNEPLRELMDSYKLKTLVMLMIKEDPSKMWNKKDIKKNNCDHDHNYDKSQREENEEMFAYPWNCRTAY